MKTLTISNSYDILLSKITEKTANVAVIGAGYVGLTLSVQLAKASYKVCAFDLDEVRVNKIIAGESYIEGVLSEDIQSLVKMGLLNSSTDMTKLDAYDVLIICVPTPLNMNKEPDISSLVRVSEKICETINSTKLIVIESTTFPSTTKSLVLPIIENSGKTIGENIFLAHSPERVDFGDALFTRDNVPKVVGGITDKCSSIATQFYSQFVSVIPVSDTTIAEMVKLFENTYRSVNIGLVNEFALLCDRMDLNSWEILDAAFTKPFGIQEFYPGPGVGGHCIPVDPFYLLWKAREYDFNFKTIEVAVDINTNMPYHVVNKLLLGLSNNRVIIPESRVLIIGVAFKRDISDIRTSPALKLIEIIEKYNIEVIYHDPLVPEMNHLNKSYKSIPLNEIKWNTIDASLIVTDHSTIDYEKIVQSSKLVIDTRNATKEVKENREKIILI